MPSMVKEMMLKEIRENFEANPYTFISNFEGLTVADIVELRGSLEKSTKRSLVIKHTLVKKIFKERSYTEAEKFLNGSVLFTFCEKDPQMASKALMDFAKGNQKLVPAGVIFEGKIYDQAFVEQLSKLLSRQELLTQVVVRIKSPISGLVMTLGQVMRGVVVALNAIKQKKETAPQAA